MQNKPDNQVNAGFFVRLAAYLVDLLIVGVALLFVRIPVAISTWITPENILVKDLIFQYSAMDIICYLLTVSYFIFLTYFTGATIGKKMFHLRVVSKEERKLTFFEVAFRETVGRFLSKLIVNVGYLMIGIHKEKHGLHDMLSDTEVIYYHEKKVAVETPVEIQQTAVATYSPNNYMVPNDITEQSSVKNVEENDKNEMTAESTLEEHEKEDNKEEIYEKESNDVEEIVEKSENDEVTEIAMHTEENDVAEIPDMETPNIETPDIETPDMETTNIETKDEETDDILIVQYSYEEE